MRQWVWIVVVFAVVFILWRIFWTSVFAIWDNANTPAVLILFAVVVAFLYFRGRRKQQRPK